jgi:hypothetical protein
VDRAQPAKTLPEREVSTRLQARRPLRTAEADADGRCVRPIGVQLAQTEGTSMGTYSEARDTYFRLLLRVHPRVRAFVLDVMAPAGLLLSFCNEPMKSLKSLIGLPTVVRGTAAAERWNEPEDAHTLRDEVEYAPQNPLEKYFFDHKDGPMIFKWTHYFSVYNRHLSKFISKKVNIVEVGIYGGGSLSMWSDYFGEECTIYGVDINQDCKIFEKDRVHIFIGDQANRAFWAEFKKNVPKIDVFIDDGGHDPEQQIVSLEEILTHLNSNGVYICEDVHGKRNRFTDYLTGYINELNTYETRKTGQLACETSNFQKHIYSIHFYPFITVIEKTPYEVRRFVARKHGYLTSPT